MNRRPGIYLEGTSIVITLDKLNSNDIPQEIWDATETTELEIQKTQPISQWSTRPPLSWYETVEFTSPYWILNNQIGRLENLQTLILIDLDIQRLPDSIVELQKLEMLNLSFNKLELTNELDKLKKLTNLKHLILYGNHYIESEMQAYKNMFPDLIIEYKDENN